MLLKKFFQNEIPDSMYTYIQFPKINILPLVKSTMEMKSIWQGKPHPKNAASL